MVSSLALSVRLIPAQGGANKDFHQGQEWELSNNGAATQPADPAPSSLPRPPNPASSSLPRPQTLNRFPTKTYPSLGFGLFMVPLGLFHMGHMYIWAILEFF